MELTFGQQPEGAFDGVLGLAVEGLEVIRMVPQLQFQAGAAMFGELHGSILMDRVRGISYERVVNWASAMAANHSRKASRWALL